MWQWNLVNMKDTEKCPCGPRGKQRSAVESATGSAARKHRRPGLIAGETRRPETRPRKAAAATLLHPGTLAEHRVAQLAAGSQWARGGDGGGGGGGGGRGKRAGVGVSGGRS